MQERRSGELKLEADVTEIKEDIRELKKILLGNGEPGIYAKVAIMWGYRNIFAGLFAVNLLSLVTTIVVLVKKLNIFGG